GHAAVVFGARHTPSAVLAGNEPPLTVARVAVGKIRRLAVDARAAGFFVPAHDPVVGDVAPQETTGVAEIDRPLAPAHAAGEPFPGALGNAMLCKARIENLNRRIGIALVRFPAAQRRPAERRRRNRAGSGNDIASRDHRISSHAFLRSLWTALA